MGRIIKTSYNSYLLISIEFALHLSKKKNHDVTATDASDSLISEQTLRDEPNCGRKGDWWLHSHNTTQVGWTGTKELTLASLVSAKHDEIESG